MGVAQLPRHLEKKITPKNKRTRPPGRIRKQVIHEEVDNAGTDDGLATFIEHFRQWPAGVDLGEVLSWNPYGATRVYAPASPEVLRLRQEFEAAVRVAPAGVMREAVVRALEVVEECQRNDYFLLVYPD
ncbi:hypothetical protein Krad_2251 [Kineococcus radiotolerans SRS30216 = ATCC BAA-149]|uniref:Uncharacterized protein n=1 Tax=Kineococcus radiotolerans (strain ATCC BAA-149 / DSM 14245 / SRS30216) TaxID=266940 RepID=A6WA93_KINRD|nr:hypothetical protein Krad_2251 [Kineococcus radiotolerans SRS30216 = ATCC BAA-149]